MVNFSHWKNIVNTPLPLSKNGKKSPRFQGAGSAFRIMKRWNVPMFARRFDYFSQDLLDVGDIVLFFRRESHYERVFLVMIPELLGDDLT